MKLLDGLREQVNKLGTLKRAWFTSFNLGIPFFETHVLPVLLDADAPSSRMDYETLQLQLVERGIDVRVFCDLRCMEAGQLKRTAVPVHGILPQWLGADGFGETSLFHPKVICLEGNDGRLVLGAGSANLSVSGWGRNQEVFVFREVSDNEQYRQIARFFQPLMQTAGLDEAQGFGVRRRFEGRDAGWSFMHSFERAGFLQRLLAGIDAERLTVWSPYFSHDLAGLLGRIGGLADRELAFHVVPDRVENRYLRLPWRPELGQLIDEGVLSFHDRPLPCAKEIEMTHAKLWLAAGRRARLAVGSWNCTEPGCASFEARNVEAGILLDVAPDTPVAGPLLNLRPEDFGSAELLQEEALQLTPYPLPFELRVGFDWERQRYAVQGELHAAIVGTAYTLRLPGLTQRLELRWKARRSEGAWPLEPIEHELADNEALLADHSYEVWRADSLEYRGIVQETGQAHRRALGYDSLTDLLNDLVDGVESAASGTPRLRQALRHDDAPDDEPAPAAPVAGGVGLSYFRLFHAFEQFRERLRAVDGRPELEKLLFVYPGSLQELVSKVNGQTAAAAANTVFDWFLVQEAESLYATALQAYARCREKYARTAPPADARWASLKPQAQAVPLPAPLGGNADYLRELCKVCGYAG